VANRGQQKAKGGLAAALGIPPEYLDAAAKKISPETITTLKYIGIRELMQVLSQNGENEEN